jgi:hypothetical protein
VAGRTLHSRVTVSETPSYLEVVTTTVTISAQAMTMGPSFDRRYDEDPDEYGERPGGPQRTDDVIADLANSSPGGD